MIFHFINKVKLRLKRIMVVFKENPIAFRAGTNNEFGESNATADQRFSVRL
jgi:hypothetical protein